MSKPLDSVFLPDAKFMGVVTPSGNTVVERVTMAILENFPQVTPLFSRTPVFGETDAYPASYDLAGMLGAVRLLAHAKPDVIVWNGSKGAKIGVAHDHAFAAQVQAETGVPCSTSIIAMEQILRERQWRRVAVVTPYDDSYQVKLIAALQEAGYEVVGESHAAQKGNLSFASISAEAIETLVRRAVASSTTRPDVILVLCTNLPAAPVVPALEEEFDIPILDSTSLGVWAGLRLLGVDTAPASAWGRLFSSAMPE